MDKKSNMPGAPDWAKEEKPITYRFDKREFIVTPVYREDSGKTIHELILELMKKDDKKP